MLNFFKNNNLTAPAFIISLSIILTGLIFATSANTFANKTDSITVTGSAERFVTSDTAKWTINITNRVNDIKSGNDSMQTGSNAVVKYLSKAGIDNKNIQLSGTSNVPVCAIGAQGYENCALGIVGYNFGQSVTVEGDNVDKIKSLSKEINGNFNNINMTSSVEYYYNNLKNIRAEMLSEATKNALERAKSVADAGGANIGKITSLSSGVFQVTARNSVNYDDSGSYDTAEMEKKITATVKANFSVK